MRWVRRWRYELRWERGHSGVQARHVDTVAQLRAVVEWARANPRVRRCSYRVTYDLEGERVERCPAGHSLRPPMPWRAEPAMRLLACQVCPGHYLMVCPDCGARVLDPPAEPGCRPD